MRWTDGSWYQGEWDRGIQHGYGKMTFPDGTVKEGYFENNVYKIKVQVDPSQQQQHLLLQEQKMFNQMGSNYDKEML